MVYKNVKNTSKKNKMTSSTLDILFIVMEEERKQKIFKFKKLESENDAL